MRRRLGDLRSDLDSTQAGAVHPDPCSGGERGKGRAQGIGPCQGCGAVASAAGGDHDMRRLQFRSVRQGHPTCRDPDRPLCAQPDLGKQHLAERARHLVPGGGVLV